MEHVILVDQNDRAVGTCEKIEAHEKALLHRAFSVFIFNKKRETLLQKRWQGKYHSGGLWTNTCCGHPRPGENTLKGATRRLHEETGGSCDLEKSFAFTYRAPFDNGLTEHEYVHVFSGIFEGPFTPDPQEIEDLKWVSLEWIKEDILKHPQSYTQWFKLYFTEKWDDLIKMRE